MQTDGQPLPSQLAPITHTAGLGRHACTALTGALAQHGTDRRARTSPAHPQEIGAFAWHYLHELPATVEEANRAYIASGGSRHRFFMVGPAALPALLSPHLVPSSPHIWYLAHPTSGT